MNLIYNKFLSEYIRQGIDLTDSETIYRIALLTEAYTPSTTDTSFATLVQAGYEISGEGYEAGGREIVFTDPVIEDNRINFTGSRTIWEDASFTARYAIIYRESDNLLISCYDFGINQTVEDGTFTLNWKNIYTISISLDGSDDAGYRHVDDKLSRTSSNPVSNKTLTLLFEKLGLLIGGELAPEEAEVIAEDIDTLNRVTELEIDRIFGIVRHVPISYLNRQWNEDKQEYEWAEIGFVCAFLNRPVTLPSYEDLTGRTREGYTFGGWYFCKDFDERSFVGMPGDNYTFTKVETDVHLYARWIQDIYSVSFDALGVVENPETIEATYNDPIILPNLSSENYTLVDWTYDRDHTQFAGKPGDSFIVRDNAHLYANWTEKLLTVTFYLDEGTEVYATQKVRVGELATRPSDPVKEGYTFTAWYSDPAFEHEYTFISGVFVDTTLHAKFVEN